MTVILSKPGGFEDDDIPIYPALGKIILEHNCIGGVGEEVRGKPELAYAFHGIKTFVNLNLTDK